MSVDASGLKRTTVNEMNDVRGSLSRKPIWESNAKNKNWLKKKPSYNWRPSSKKSWSKSRYKRKRHPRQPPSKLKRKRRRSLIISLCADQREPLPRTPKSSLRTLSKSRTFQRTSAGSCLRSLLRITPVSIRFSKLMVLGVVLWSNLTRRTMQSSQ